jgi:hypothetical protein
MIDSAKDRSERHVAIPVGLYEVENPTKALAHLMSKLLPTKFAEINAWSASNLVLLVTVNK